MLFECELVSGKFYEEDSDKLGWIRVKYNGKIRWARPSNLYGEFRVPTQEWIDKYAQPTGRTSRIGVYCAEVNNQKNLVWMGFTFYRGGLPSEALTNYSYTQIRFTEEWMEVYDDKDKTYSITDSSGTRLEIAPSGTKINDKNILLEGFIDWLKQWQAQLVLGNLGAPAPINPAAFADLEAKLLQDDVIISNRPSQQTDL